MSAPLVWILATASALLLATGGFLAAVARFRARVISHRRQAARLGARLESTPADPFGELRLIAEQLRKIQQRLGHAEDVAGLEVQTVPGEGISVPPAGQDVSITGELERDLDLFKKELYAKTSRIDELEGEKKLLADKIVTLEKELERRPELAQGPPTRRGSKDSSMDLVDVLQQEADGLRAQVAERDRLIQSLERADSSGLTKEVRRIRAELLERNDELEAVRARLAESRTQPGLEARLAELGTRLAELEQERDALAERARKSEQKLHRAKERIEELGRLQVGARAMAQPTAASSAHLGSGPAAPPPVPMPDPSRPPAGRSGRRPTPPPLPGVSRSGAAPAVPSPRSPRSPGPPPRRSPGFPDEPTIKTGPPKITPPPRMRRPAGVKLPPPRAKKDLLD